MCIRCAKQIYSDHLQVSSRWCERKKALPAETEVVTETEPSLHGQPPDKEPPMQNCSF